LLADPKILVAQIGARRRYAVPRGLAQAGCLHSVVTDACDAVPPWRYLRGIVPQQLRPRPLRAVLDRRLDGVAAECIRGCATFFLATQLRARARAAESKVSLWVRQNEAFGKAVVRVDWGSADTVYAFNGAALEIFERARRHGLRCVLDQTAAPWRYNTQLLSREQVRWPGWEDRPADMDPGGQMMAREEAEWALADHIVCGSPFVIEAIRSVGGPAEKCRLVPYPVPDHAPLIQRKEIARGRRLRVLFVGTLQLRKGIQYVWDTVRRLGKDHVECRAVGPSELTADAEGTVGSCIDWQGPVGRHDVWSHYAWADVFFLPTLSEGSANVCWEAAASGTPVVTTSAAGVVDAGATIVPLESDAMAAELLMRAREPRHTSDFVARRRSLAEYGADLVGSLS